MAIETEKLGSVIREYRKKAGLSQDQLARKLDITGPTVFKYESGKLKKIPYEKMEQMAVILGIPKVDYGEKVAFFVNDLKPEQIKQIEELISFFRWKNGKG